MNQTINTIMQRRSLRVFDPAPLSDEEKSIILQAAMRAPTAGAMMLYSIIEIEDQTIKDSLAKSCDNQPFIAQAPYALLFLADYQRWMDLYHQAGCPQRADELGIANRLPGEGDMILAAMDALIAAQTAVIAAESLGIGSCYIGDIIENWEQHRDLFNLPQYAFPAALLVFGHPRSAATRELTPRFEQQYVVYKNAYRRLSPDELDNLFLPFGSRSFEAHEYPNGAQNVVQANYIRKFTSDFSIEMTRSMRLILKNWQG